LVVIIYYICIIGSFKVSIFVVIAHRRLLTAVWHTVAARS